MAGRGGTDDGDASPKQEVRERLSRRQGLDGDQAVLNRMRFELATAGRILFGAEVSRELGALASTFGTRALVVTGAHPDRHAHLLAALRQGRLSVECTAATGEPTVEDAAQAVAAGRALHAEMVIAIGGGSALDLGKAAAALLVNPGDITDYLEVVGLGRELGNPSLPFIAVPTTAGTGSEVTRNAVLRVPTHGVKVSLRSAHMLPRMALIDPTLAIGTPPAITASTGLDALTQVVEPFVSNAANPLVDPFCRDGMARAARSLCRVVEQGDDLSARTDMAFASLCGGLALANAKLGAVHGLAGPIGGRFNAPHGAVCARLLPLVMEANVRALAAREPAHPVRERFREVATILTGDARADVHAGIAWIESTCRRLEVPGLATYGVEIRDLTSLVQQAKLASSMQGNPVRLLDADLLEILTAAL